MLKVLKSGFYTSIQDKGRFGQRNYGVPVSGVMDSYSSQFANAIIGNSKEAAVIEITMTGPSLQFLKPTIIAISGANIQPQLNNVDVEMNLCISIKANDILSFGRLKTGFRAYLAVKDGFQSPLVLGSRSMYKAITIDNRIQGGDIIEYESYDVNNQSANATIKCINEIIELSTLEVYKGPEFNKLADDKQKQLLEITFKVSKLNSRMAYQLEPIIENNLEQILTAPVLPGTLQLTPSGQLIVLMRDCQTTGGYPRVLQLTEKSINILSQKTTGSNLKIRLKV
ncbi:biotin-dependent carboxyltransferase family protein [Winogradskyella sp. PG-2]|uniref:5-oxoprolinase subunit C family protein n=1 Tax=Winogradskyella sp. PG-2 TaxID=754409 RepID=UPI00045891F0|nr:biotin-dependent carboxyltransferase family protein [Winogradskyella sp. PG-2]BAO77640.1 allophanate hydrolase 2 subunit 2 [Winogradskyella sp. PG-2]